MEWVEASSPALVAARVRLTQAALAARPDHLPLWLALSESLAAAGEPEAALAHARAASEHFPDASAVRLMLAEALHRLGRYDEALSVLSEPAGERGLALALRLAMRCGRKVEAAMFADGLEHVAPAAAILIEYRGLTLADDPAALIAACDRALAGSPGHANAIYFRAVALSLLGRSEEAGVLMAIDQLTGDVRMSLSADLLGASVAEVLANPTLQTDPAGQATRGGLQTGALPVDGNVAMPLVLAAIRSAIMTYSDALALSHPWAKARPPRASFQPWAVVLRGGGHQAVHRHPDGWLTGVCYLAVPPGTGDAGALRIGVAEDALGTRPPWPVRIVRPVPGRLILFPSFMPHDTVPNASDEARISIAFDVIAA